MPDCETQEIMLNKLVQRSINPLVQRSAVANGDIGRSVKASPSKRRSTSIKHTESSLKRPKTLQSPLPSTYQQFSDVCGQKWKTIHEQSSDSLESLDTSTSSSTLLTSYLSSVRPELKLVRSTLADLISKEAEFHPNIDFLFKVDPDRENKVNAAMRDEAVFNLRFLHMYYQLSPLTFVQAVSLIDRFIVKVKVKPKYMACVATACYHIAAMEHEKGKEKDIPKAEDLVLFSRCGGTANDLLKMEQIIKSKPVGTNAITILDFLQAMIGENHPIPEQVIAQLHVVLCSVRIHTYRPVTVAFALLMNYNRQGVHELYLPRNRLLKRLMNTCQLTWAEITDCAHYLMTNSEDFYSRRLALSRGDMVWALSRRTLYNLSCSSPPALVTITEDESDENSVDKKNGKLVISSDTKVMMSGNHSSLSRQASQLMSVDEEAEEEVKEVRALEELDETAPADFPDLPASEDEPCLRLLFEEFLDSEGQS